MVNSNRIHGSRGRYKDGCRCPQCKAAQSIHQRQYRYENNEQHPKVSSGQVRPLIECMIAAGSNRQRIGNLIGVSPQTLRLDYPTVNARVARSVEELHWGLWKGIGDFRAHCGCPIPTEVAYWLYDQDVSA